MALEAVVYSSQDPFSYISCKDFVFQDLYFQDQEDIKNTIKLGQEQEQDQEQGKGKGEEFVRSKNGDDEDYKEEDLHVYRSTVNAESQAPAAAGGGRRKRRRTRSSKNKEEMENQRMTHIAVERNRRKQMNDYLAVLRSLMPPSYAQRGDQASIIGGAINYVKELEHLLQSMESPKTKTTTNETDQPNTTSASKVPFSDFFTFPQYSTRSSSSAAAEIEVTMVESHANLKILVKKRPRQLIKLVASIQSLKLTLLHLNVTTLHVSVLYSISVKVEEGSQLNTVEDIAAAVNQILRRIEEEFSSSSSLSSLSSSFS